MRGGTRSEGARTPRLRRTGTTVTSTAATAADTVTTAATTTTTINNNIPHHTPAASAQPMPPLMHSSAHQTASTTASASASCGERHLDVLYLRAAASQPPKQLVEKMYAQLKPKPSKSSSASGAAHNVYHTIASAGHATAPTTTSLAASAQHPHHHHYQQVMMRSNCGAAIVKPQAVVLTSADDYVLLQNHHQIQQQQQQQQLKLQYHHQHPPQQQQHHQQPIYQATGSVISSVSAGKLSAGAATSVGAATAAKCLLRQTLLAITDNYLSGTMAVHKGDVVTLLACRQVVDARTGQPVQWFFVRARDGTQGYIPAEVAGHGFL